MNRFNAILRLLRWALFLYLKARSIQIGRLLLKKNAEIRKIEHLVIDLS